MVCKLIILVDSDDADDDGDEEDRLMVELNSVRVVLLLVLMDNRVVVVDGVILQPVG